MKLLITKGSDPNVFHDHGFHAIFQVFLTASFLAGGGKLALLDWVIRKQENFEFDVHAVDVLGQDLIQLIIKAEMDPSSTGGAQQTRLVDALLAENLCLDNQDFEGSTALHQATKFGLLNVVEQLTNAFANPIIKDNRGRTPLHYAAIFGNVAIVRRLLGKSNAGINDSDVVGWTPLRLAVIGHQLNMVKVLIDLGAQCDHVHLDDAVRNNYEQMFDYLLTIGIRPDIEVLYSAICRPNLYFLRSCILAGASLNPPRGTWTPLSFAVLQKRTSAVQLLLSMGADVDFRTDDGTSALLLAVESGEVAMVDILMRAGAATHDLSFEQSPTINLMMLATRMGFACIAEKLYEAGAPKPAAGQISANSSFDMMAAVKQNRIDILTELIRKNGDPSMNQDELYYAFKLACMRGNSEAARFLINADLDLHMERRSPPLCQAARECLTDVVQALLDKGADKNQLDCAGRTALFYVLHSMWDTTRTPYDEVRWIAEKLIRAGIDVNVVSKEGHTALGMACCLGCTSIAVMLLEVGADISIPSREHHRGSWRVHPETDARSVAGLRYLPLELAAKAGHDDIVQLLLAKGADWRSLKQQKAIATSHSVLVTHWFADEGNADDEETIFLGCEPPEAQLKVSYPRGASFADVPNQSSSLSIIIRPYRFS